MSRQKTSTEIIKDLFWDVVFITLGALAEVLALSLILGKNLGWDFIVVVCIVPFLIYFFDFVEDLKDNDHYLSEKETLKKHRAQYLYIVVILAVVSVAITVIYGSYVSALVLLIALLSGWLYPLYLKPLTKRIIGFKDFYVAFIWNLFIVFFITYTGVTLNLGIILLLCFIFIRDLINISYCDLKDYDRDRSLGLKTFVVSLGRERYFHLSLLLNIASIIILGFAVIINLLPLHAIGLLVPATMVGVLVYVSKYTRRYSWIIVDSEYFLWFIFALLFVLS